MKERSCRTVVAHLALAAITFAAWPAHAADPSTTECLSAYEGSIKLRELHKLSDARMRLLLCAAASCPAEIRTECTRHLPEVEAAVPTIVFEAKDPSGNDIAAVVLMMDGTRLADRLDGTSIALDPGEHLFMFQVGTGPRVEKRLVIHEGEKNRRERVVVSPSPQGGSTPVPRPDTSTATSPAAPARAAEAPTTAPSNPSSWSTGRTLALVSGGVGVVGIALGGVFGGIAASKWSQAKSDCGGGCAPDAPAQGEKSSAANLATVSTVGFVVGAAGLAGGVALWFIAPSGGAVQIAPAVGRGTTGLRLQGEF